MEATPIKQETPPTIEPQVEAPKEPAQNTRSRAKNAPLTPAQLKQKIANVVVHPRLKPTKLQHGEFSARPNRVTVRTLRDTEFLSFEDIPLNKRGYKYKPCRPNLQMKSNLYSTTDLEPQSVRASYFDRALGVLCSEDMSTVTTDRGWLSVRANVGLREGSWYFEFEILNANTVGCKGHVRVGVGRKEAALEGPVGFDGYGYGCRDLNGQKITLSRPKAYFPEGEGFATGDVIGVLLELPPLSVHRALNAEFASNFQATRKKRKRGQFSADDEEKKLNLYNNIVRDQVPIKYKNELYFEQFAYSTTKQMDHLLNPVTVFGEKAVLETSTDTPKVPTIPGLKITMFKNGVNMGTMYEDLFSFLPMNMEDDAAATEANTRQLLNPSYRNTDDGLLGYYPMMSVYSDGMVKLNPGPEFKNAIPDAARPLCERYTERVVDEWMWDLVDEIENEYLDEFE